MKQADLSDKILNLITNLVSEFKDIPRMSKVTENKLLNTLHTFQTPGGPYFPPRDLRQLATRAARDLIPAGQHERWVTHVVFRMVHPWYTTKSCVYHGVRLCKNNICCCFNK